MVALAFRDVVATIHEVVVGSFVTLAVVANVPIDVVVVVVPMRVALFAAVAMEVMHAVAVNHPSHFLLTQH